MKKRTIALISVAILSVALLGYTIGNLTYQPKVEYVDKIEYVDRVEYVDKTGKNNWTIKIVISNVTVSIGVFEEFLNAEYENQNATIRFYFYQTKYESIRIKFGFSITAKGTKGWIGKDGNFYNSSQWIAQEFHQNAILEKDKVLWLGSRYGSPQWGFTTPNILGTYILQISIGIYETTIL